MNQNFMEEALCEPCFSRQLLREPLFFSANSYARSSQSADRQGDDVVVEVAGDGDGDAIGGSELAPGQKTGLRYKKFGRKFLKFGGNEGFLGRYKLVWQELGLSAEQREKLFTAQQKFRSSMFAGNQTEQRGHFDLRASLSGTSIDEGRANAAIDSIADATRSQLSARVDFVKEMRAILTPDQRLKLNDRLAQMGPMGDGKLRAGGD